MTIFQYSLERSHKTGLTVIGNLHFQQLFSYGVTTRLTASECLDRYNEPTSPRNENLNLLL
jgi:hypothetical protein